MKDSKSKEDGRMSNLNLLAIMFCAGITIALQPSINSRLAQKVGVLESACISFAVGTVFLIAVVLLTGKLNIKGLSDIAWWELTGGVLGAIFVSATIFVVPRIGTAAAMAATISAQLITGLILDHFGAFGVKEVHFGLKRALGCALLAGGVILIGKR
jgi:transporter family-2 protein